jgi:hypothetical protein
MGAIVLRAGGNVKWRELNEAAAVREMVEELPSYLAELRRHLGA